MHTYIIFYILGTFKLLTQICSGTKVSPISDVYYSNVLNYSILS